MLSYQFHVPFQKKTWSYRSLHHICLPFKFESELLVCNQYFPKQWKLTYLSNESLFFIFWEKQFKPTMRLAEYVCCQQCWESKKKKATSTICCAFYALLWRNSLSVILFNKCGFIEQVKSFFSCLPECNISFVIKRNTKKERQEKGEIKGREEGRKKEQQQ